LSLEDRDTYALPTVNEIILPKTGEQSPQDANFNGKVYFLQEVCELLMHIFIG
jgi:hypothetical protein